MSKELRQSQQQQMKQQKEFMQEMMKANYYANNSYFSFQATHPNYYYNFMYPYTSPTYFPYYSAHTTPSLDAQSNEPESVVAKIEEKDQVLIKHPNIKSQICQQKNCEVKIEECLPVIEQKQEKLETAKRTSKKNNKQLYLMEISQSLPKKCEKDINQLLDKFKKVIKLYLQENVQEKFELRSYEDEFEKYIKEDKTFFEELMICLGQRFRLYKKTKEELIKLIIRRTYHNLRLFKNNIAEKPQYERLQAFHQKNLATFKSMNSNFLKRQFSNQLFVLLFKEFMANFEEQFQKENAEKTQRFALVLVTCWFERSTNLLMNERKLPWASIYKQKIQKICISLLKEYEDLTSKDEEPKK